MSHTYALAYFPLDHLVENCTILKIFKTICTVYRTQFFVGGRGSLLERVRRVPLFNICIHKGRGGWGRKLEAVRLIEAGR